MFTITSNSGLSTITEKISILSIDTEGLVAYVESSNIGWYLAKYRDINNTLAIQEDDIKFMKLKDDIIKAMEEYEKRTNLYESYHYKITSDFRLERIHL